MSTVRRLERLDFKMSELAQPVVTQEGYLVLDGKVARSGIQLYMNADGSQRRELRLPDDVKDSLPGFNLKPLTNNHPPSLVRPENASQFVCGSVGDAEYADGWVKAPVAVWTKDAIDAIKAGRAQLSVGYTCKVVDEAGEYQGERYDCRQTNIVVNHVALVDAARAGPDARLRLDASDAVTYDDIEVVRGWVQGNGRVDATQVGSVSATPTSDTKETTKMPIKMRLDGLEIEVADSQAQSIIERALAASKKDGDDRVAEIRAKLDAAQKDVDAQKAKVTELQAKADQLEAASKKDAKCDNCDGTGKVNGKECEDCGGSGKMKMDALLDFDRRKASRERSMLRAAQDAGASRAKLLVLASEHLSKHENLDGKTDVDIKKLVLKKLDAKIVLDGKDDTYVNHRFEFEMDSIAKTTKRAIDVVRLVNDPENKPVVDGKGEGGEIVVETVDDARALMQERNRKAFVKRA